MAGGKVLRSRRATSMEAYIDNCDHININVLVMESKLLGFNLLLRIDVIERMGGVHITKMGDFRCSMNYRHG